MRPSSEAPKIEQRPHIEDDVPPAAVNEGARDEGQVVVRVQAMDVRPSRIEITPGNQGVAQREVVSRASAKLLLIEEDGDVC